MKQGKYGGLPEFVAHLGAPYRGHCERIQFINL